MINNNRETGSTISEESNIIDNKEKSVFWEKGMLDFIFQDALYHDKHISRFTCIKRYFFFFTFHVTVKFRLIQYMKIHKKNRYLIKLLEFTYGRSNMKRGIYLPTDTCIGAGVIFPHAFPLVIHPASVIGENCIIHPNVRIGTSRTKEGAPIIGDNCFLGNGCHIIGNCRIGDWSFISPGAFVCKDIPEGSVVGFGINNIISNKGKETVLYYI